MFERDRNAGRGPATQAFYRPGRGRRIRGADAAILAAIALLGAWTAPPTSARAQAGAAAARVDEPDGRADGRRAALRHFEAAERLFEARRYREAIHEFELAHANMPSADLYFNIARCHEELGDARQAIEFYRRYLEDRVDAPDAAEVRSRIERLEAEEGAVASRMRAPRGRLRIDSNLAGALVTLDGAGVGVTPIEGALALEPGRYRIAVTHPGYLPFHAEISVAGSGSLTVGYAQLEPAAADRKTPTTSAWPWVVGSLAAASLIASGVLAVLGARAGPDGGAHGYFEAAEWSLAGGVALAVGAGTLAFTTSGEQ